MDQESTVVNTEAVQDTAPTEPTSEESKLEVVTEGAPLNPNDYNDEPAETEGKADPEEEAKPVETEAPDDKPEEELAPKSVNRFQQLANENKALKEQLERVEARKAQVAQEQQLLDEINPETGDYFTPQEVERIAYFNSRKAEQERLNTEQSVLQVRLTQEQLANEAQQALSSYAMFDEAKKDAYKPAVTQLADSLLQDSLYMDGESQAVVGSKISPLKIYETVAKVYEQGMRDGQLKGQQSASKMFSQTDTPSSAPVKRSKSDEASMSPDEYAKAKGMNVVWQ